MAIPAYGINPQRFATGPDLSPVFAGIQGLGQSVQARGQEKAQQQAAQARQKKLAEASEIFKGGDTDAMADFMIRNPDVRTELMEAQKFVNEATKQKRLESLTRVAMGEPVGKVTQEASLFIQSQGGTTEQTDAFAQIPQEQAQKAAMAELAVMMEPQQFKNFAQAIGRTSPEVTQKLDLEREKLDLRRLESGQRGLDRQLGRETNDLKRLEIQGRIDARQLALNEKKKNITKSISQKAAGDKATQSLVDDMLSDEGLDMAVGMRSILPTLPGGKASDYEVMFETLKSKQFLSEITKMKGMGSLSESEGNKVAAAAESLSLAQSPSAHREALKRIKEGLSTAAEPGTYSEPSQTVNWADL